MRKVLIASGIVVAIGLAWVYANHRTWGPALLGDKQYASGRPSICKSPSLSGDSLALIASDLGRRARLKGFEHDWEYNMPSSGLSGGVIVLCSEYGSIRVRGVDSGEARLRVTISDPFPGGGPAIDDTRLNLVARRDSGRLHLAVWQATQGMTTFKSMMQKGARVAAVNITLELPRRGVYRLDLVANHQRLTVERLDIEGQLAGYLSPGANLDVGLAGPLVLELYNKSVKPHYRREAGIDFEGGTNANLRVLTSTNIVASFKGGDAVLTFLDIDTGLDVTAKAVPAPATVSIGPEASRHVDASGVRVQSAGYGSAKHKVVLRATTGGGTVTVKRAQ